MELNKCESRVLHVLRSFGEDFGLNFRGIASELRERHKEEWGKTRPIFATPADHLRRRV